MAKSKKFDTDSDSNSEKNETFSSNINEVFRPVLNFLFFLAIRFQKYKKA